MIDWEEIDYFTREEFDDPEVPGSGDKVDESIVLALDKLRKKSGMRIITHNKYGVRGCVCVSKAGHSKNSLHYVENGASAIDWHFDADHHLVSIRDQAKLVLEAGFGGVGIYYDWKWPDCKDGGVPIGFHTDMRKRYQIWTRKDGEYLYFLK
jgi:hypothetical protein